MCTNTANIQSDFGKKKKNPNHATTKKNPISTKQWAKYISSNVAMSLLTVNEKSPLYKSYWNTYYCNDVIKVDENGKATSSYCKNRWCYSCNRIRTAILIKGYLPELQSFKESFFITLTRPTCSEKELPGRIKEMMATSRRINDLCRKDKYYKELVANGNPFKGLRKIECTLRPNDKYHPHFHMIVNDERIGNLIIEKWLKQNPDADRKAQDIRKADAKAHKELFKYFTKLNESKRKPGEALSLNYKRLDVIFQAMKGIQVFRPFGFMTKLAKEDFDDNDLEATLNLGSDYANQLFSWLEEDWVNKDTGEYLVGKNVPTKVKNILPKKAEEKEAIEAFNYLPPVTTICSVTDAFDLEEVPTPWQPPNVQKEKERMQKIFDEIAHATQRKKEQKENTNQLEMAIPG